MLTTLEDDTVTHGIKKEPHGPAASEPASRRGGPRTPHGKARTRLNATKSGIFAKLVLTGEPFRERQDDFQKLLADLRRSIRPRDCFEEILLENLGFQFFRLVRFYPAEAGAAPILFRIVREKMESDIFDSSPKGAPQEEPFGAGKLPAADLLMRYESAIWRQIDRIVQQLDRWRRACDGRASPESGISK